MNITQEQKELLLNVLAYAKDQLDMDEMGTICDLTTIEAEVGKIIPSDKKED
jgi:hypothetical protein